MKPIAVAVDGLEHGSGARPLTFGLPFPAGALFDTESIRLSARQADIATASLPVQTRALADWPDGSVAWLLIDTLLPAGLDPDNALQLDFDGQSLPVASPLQVQRDATDLCIDTGAARFVLPASGSDSSDIRVEHPLAALAALELLDERGRSQPPRIDDSEVEEQGPVRVSVHLRGNLGSAGLRFTARCCFFAGTAWMRMLLTIENPARARHRRGVWDLGDPGSQRFRELALVVRCDDPTQSIRWTASRGEAPRQGSDRVRIYQDSSGGENWQSPVHRNAAGRVPTTFRGFRVDADGARSDGMRAEPIVGLYTARGAVAAAVTEFWQSFPTAIEADRRALRLCPFPRDFAEAFELQGGEHKTRTLWLDFDADWCGDAVPLSAAQGAVTARAARRWYADAGVDAGLAAADLHPVAAAVVDAAAAGPNSLAARCERADEYGWRNHGDLFADHEERYYRGTAPLVSHYNNQYDVLHGSLLHYLWSGDTAWRDVAMPLCRHIVDIDLYNTARDRAAYNGGLFWHTDHYRDSGTATHRTYSAINRGSPWRRYGGGPSCENNYTSGLLLFHYLTGDRRAREAVLQLADWVIAMDDGRSNVLGLFDDGPTGLASRTRDSWYHGPGRGAGNSLNALLDAWLLAGTEGGRYYLDKAEQIVRRVVDPSDDPERNELRDIERRWSYLIFLQALARYLELKLQRDRLDEAYDHARRSLLNYGRWMLAHETPYFERREQLQYPTEAWPAIDVLKANVMRAAACHAEVEKAAQLAEKADSLSERAWSDLAQCPHRDSARAVSHILVQGLRDASWRENGITARPAAPIVTTTAGRAQFESQRARVARKLRSPRAWPDLLRRLLDPRVWKETDLRRP